MPEICEMWLLTWSDDVDMNKQDSRCQTSSAPSEKLILCMFVRVPKNGPVIVLQIKVVNVALGRALLQQHMPQLQALCMLLGP